MLFAQGATPSKILQALSADHPQITPADEQPVRRSLKRAKPVRLLLFVCITLGVSAYTHSLGGLDSGVAWRISSEEGQARWCAVYSVSLRKPRCQTRAHTRAHTNARTPTHAWTRAHAWTNVDSAPPIAVPDKLEVEHELSAGEGARWHAPFLSAGSGSQKKKVGKTEKAKGPKAKKVRAAFRRLLNAPCTR